MGVLCVEMFLQEDGGLLVCLSDQDDCDPDACLPDPMFWRVMERKLATCVPALAGARPMFIYEPAHYMKQFHADYLTTEELKAKVKKAGAMGDRRSTMPV